MIGISAKSSEGFVLRDTGKYGAVVLMAPYLFRRSHRQKVVFRSSYVEYIYIFWTKY